jgi:amino-acid N-acetyltransferase
MTRQLLVRAATDTDVAAIRALMAPYVRAGKLLPRAVVTAEFLVATLGRRVVGTVALTALSSGTAELGSLVSDLPGRGIGRALVEAALDAASSRGLSAVVALTDEPAFFERFAFEGAADTPWLRARANRGLGAVAPLHTTEVIASASAAKSATCAACARLAGCRQALMVRRIATTLRSHA